MLKRMTTPESRGFSLEVRPFDQGEDIDRALLYRGAIVSAWANVEFSLIEIAIRASIHNAYLSRAGSYPKRHKDRIDYLRGVLELPGPLQKYSKLGTAVLDRFDQSADFRNIMAHARMTLVLDWGATFSLFQGKPGSNFEVLNRIVRLSYDQLLSHAKRATLFSRVVRMLVAQINAIKLLPPLSDAG
jgi:hypothetical protein